MGTNDRSKNSRAHNAVLDMVFTAMFAALIAVCSLISIPVGTVPVTLQTFAVCLAAAMLGFKRGTLSVLVYILLGAVGLPVFAGIKGGIGVLSGPTGGYIIGFILTAVTVGIAADRWGRRVLPMAVAMVIGVLLCYAVGTVWFVIVTGTDIVGALTLCVVPFLLPDALKIALAVLLANRLDKAVRL